jgi:hypothetical protein
MINILMKEKIIRTSNLFERKVLHPNKKLLICAEHLIPTIIIT